MPAKDTFTVTASLVAVLLILGTADALLTKPESPFGAPATVNPPGQQSSSAQSSQAQSAVPVPPPDASTKVTQAIARQGLSAQETVETLLLPHIIPPEEAQVQRRVLLIDNDRAGAIAWTRSPKVKLYFLALKEALHTSFTPAVKDLIDQTQQREGLPPRNYLSFMDTGISEERVIFVRVQDWLYELRVVAGQEEVMLELVEALTQ